ncbi:MAG: prolipoprotein diacylglyceryl transferase family protein, partial [Thermodesulfobacteriota bacterium]
GELFFLWMAVYSVQRFLEEALRADNAPVLFGMTISQAIGVPIFAVGVIGLLVLRGRPDWTPPPWEAPAESSPKDAPASSD